jgi:hypothetical protein
MMEVLYNILTEFGVPMKLVRLIKMCLNETFFLYCKVRIGKYLFDNFAIQKVSNKEMLHQCFSNSFYNMPLRMPKNQVGLKLNGTHELLIYADDVNLLGDNIDAMERKAETLIGASKKLV